MLRRSCRCLRSNILCIHQPRKDTGRLETCKWKQEPYQSRKLQTNSLTSVTCKLMEHVIHSHSTLIVIKPSVTLSMVFGSFTPARPNFCKLSTPSAHHSKTENKSTILLDFSKAFDKVCHCKLMLKLQDYGIRGNTYKWIFDILLNRTQHVAVKGTLSEKVSVLSGVPRVQP